MRFLFQKDIPLKNPEFKENHLQFVFEEDLFHLSSDEGQALFQECQSIIDEHVDLMPNVNGNIKFPGHLIINLSSVTDNGTEPTFDVFGFIHALSTYLTEQTLGHKTNKKRKTNLAHGAPSVRVDARNASQRVKDNILHSGCWGCMGVMVDFGEADESESSGGI